MKLIGDSIRWLYIRLTTNQKGNLISVASWFLYAPLALEFALDAVSVVWWSIVKIHLKIIPKNSFRTF